MKQFITDGYWAVKWCRTIGDIEYFVEKFPNLKGKV
jgi:hypothetical protein